jgi:hypothetical protein
MLYGLVSNWDEGERAIKSNVEANYSLKASVKRMLQKIEYQYQSKLSHNMFNP